MQHTTKLGQYKRSLQSREGSNVYALWNAKDNIVAVLVRLAEDQCIYCVLAVSCCNSIQIC